MRKVPVALLLWGFGFSGVAMGASALNGRTIMLDPGHGVIDYQGRIINPGKYSNNKKIWEHRVAMQIATVLGDKLSQEGALVIYTRTPFDYWRQSFAVADDNKARGELANELNADVYVSLHCDWDTRSRIKGVTTYYKTEPSHALGAEIHAQMIKTLHATDRHLRHDTFTILEEARMPAVLVETGFISNKAEGKKLADPAYQGKVADAILAGLRNYFAQQTHNP